MANEPDPEFVSDIITLAIKITKALKEATWSVVVGAGALGIYWWQTEQATMPDAARGLVGLSVFFAGGLIGRMGDAVYRRVIRKLEADDDDAPQPPLMTEARPNREPRAESRLLEGHTNDVVPDLLGDKEGGVVGSTADPASQPQRAKDRSPA